MCHSCWQEHSSFHFNQARSQSRSVPLSAHCTDAKSRETDRRLWEEWDKKTGRERKTESESRKWVSFTSCQVQWNFPKLFQKSKLTDNSRLYCSSYIYFCQSHRLLCSEIKGESLGIWQCKVVIERTGWVQSEKGCRFYETMLSRNRVDTDKWNWIGMSLYFSSLLFVCLPQTCYASLYLWVCEWNKQKNKGEDAALEKNRKFQRADNKTECGQQYVLYWHEKNCWIWKRGNSARETLKEKEERKRKRWLMEDEDETESGRGIERKHQKEKALEHWVAMMLGLKWRQS